MNNFEKQVSLLSLAYFEEDEHPRDHGKFTSKGGDGNTDDNDYGYDREAVRAKIHAEDRSKKLGKFLSAFKLAAYAGGTYALAKSGHPLLAAALVGGAAATTYRHAIFHEAPRITLKYSLKTASLPFKVASIPFKMVNAAVGGTARGVKEGIGFSYNLEGLESSKILRVKNAVGSASLKYSL